MSEAVLRNNNSWTSRVQAAIYDRLQPVVGRNIARKTADLGSMLEPVSNAVDAGVTAGSAIKRAIAQRSLRPIPEAAIAILGATPLGRSAPAKRVGTEVAEAIAARQAPTVVPATALRPKPGLIGYHSSKAPVDKFDWQRYVGYGEGNQSESAGNYFNSRLPLNKGYSRNIRREFLDGSVVDSMSNNLDYQVTSALNRAHNAVDYRKREQGMSAADIRATHNDPYAQEVFFGTLDRMKNEYRGKMHSLDDELSDQLSSKLAEIVARRKVNWGTEGFQHQVAIDVDPSKLIDWYAPLDAQPKNAQQVLDEYLTKAKLPEIQQNDPRLVKDVYGRLTGQHVSPSSFFHTKIGHRARALQQSPNDTSHYKLVDQTRQLFLPEIYQNFDDTISAREFSEGMMSAGVPGVKYWDRSSRHHDVPLQNKTNNYVIYDNNVLNVLKRRRVADEYNYGE